MADKRSTNVADPSTALVSYLDDLLHTATATAVEEETLPDKPEPEPDPEPAKTEPRPRAVVREQLTPPEPVVAVRETLVEAGRQTLAEAEMDVVPAPSPEITAPKEVVRPVAQAREPDPEPAQPEGRPQWAGSPFECLVFKVAGLQLAVPLVLLGAIHRIDSKIKPIPGRPPWYMGMLPDRGVNLKVVDSAEWIMSGRVPEGAREGYRFVIRLDDSEWGLACDEVAESFTLDPDDVRWRTARSKRPWLAGTVVRRMCALVDVGAMAGLLARAEREHRLDLE